jgi:hypothetical protein
VCVVNTFSTHQLSGERQLVGCCCLHCAPFALRDALRDTSIAARFSAISFCWSSVVFVVADVTPLSCPLFSGPPDDYDPLGLPPAGPSTPWHGVGTTEGQLSPPGVYDLPSYSPTCVEDYYDTRGHRNKSPQF